MKLSVSMIFRAGIVWGVVAILLAIVSSVLAPSLTVVAGLTLVTFAFTMSGIHYAAKSHGAPLSSGLGGALALDEGDEGFFHARPGPAHVVDLDAGGA